MWMRAVAWILAVLALFAVTTWAIHKLTPQPLIKQLTEIAELMLKWGSLVALLLGGGWAFYKFVLEGADDWVNNISVQAQVLPYRDDLRMLVVHVKSKNPRNAKFELDRKNGTFEVRVHSIPGNLGANSVLQQGDGALLATANLMPEDGWELLPYGEFDDIVTFILPVGTIAAVTATMTKANGSTTSPGTDDSDEVSASTVVRVELDDDKAIKRPELTARRARTAPLPVRSIR